MADNTNTQGQEPEVTPNDGGNVGTQPTTTPVVETKKEEIKTYTQAELDTNAANTRRVTEKETKKAIFAKLGITLDDEDKLNAFKEAYEASLTEEDKRNTELANLQADKIKLTQDLEEKDYTIKALIELTGKNEADVEKIVKMAKGLKTDENTIEDAIKEVISMVKVEDKPTTTQTPETNPNVPVSEPLQQPSSTVVVDTQDNPFKAETFNLTKQGQLLKSNPELARKLASEAGVDLKF